MKWEKRRFLRIKVALHASLTPVDLNREPLTPLTFFDASVIDVSASGMKIAVKNRLRVGAHYRLDINFTSGNARLIVAVRHLDLPQYYSKDEHQFSYGLQIIGASQNEILYYVWCVKEIKEEFVLGPDNMLKICEIA
jgi:hypothetical protein